MFHFGKDDAPDGSVKSSKKGSMKKKISKEREVSAEDFDSLDELLPADDGVALGETPDFDLDEALRSLQH